MHFDLCVCEEMGDHLIFLSCSVVGKEQVYCAWGGKIRKNELFEKLK